MPARPYVQRLSVLSRLISPFSLAVAPRLRNGCLTVSMSRVSVLANFRAP